MLGRGKQSHPLFLNDASPGRRPPRRVLRCLPLATADGGRLAPILSNPVTSGGAVQAAHIAGSALATLPEGGGPLVTVPGHTTPNKESQLAVAGPLPGALAVVEADAQQVSAWPGKPQLGRQRPRIAKNSKAPLALQLEAFIRKEHRQYLLENPDCSRADTLHIFREAFTVVVGHFTEYKPVLNLIRDEYDAALDEMSEQVKRMRVTDLENKSDRSLHAMELIRIKESLNATISNQQAQLKASQGLLHALREQLAAAEHTNTVLKYEMERRLKEHEEAKGQVKLLSRAMIEESARTASVMEESRKKDKELGLLNARLKVGKEKIEELEACLREQTERQWRSQSDALGLFGGDTNRTATVAREEAVGRAARAMSVDEAESGPAPAAACGSGRYNDDYVVSLIARVDQLQFELAAISETAAQPCAAPPCERNPEAEGEVGAGEASASPPTAASPSSARAVVQPSRTVVKTLKPVQLEVPVLREWLRQEGITEADVGDTDYLLPPGLWPTEELAFLKACMPVANRHLTLADTLQLLEEFWSARESATDFSRLVDYFMSWLTARTGGGAALKELGINLLQTCQRNAHHPECRAILLLMRGFLPEQLVLTWRQQLRRLEKDCEAAARQHGGADRLSADEFFPLVRCAFPGKPRAHLLQLRFFAQRCCGDAESMDYQALLAPDAYFVMLLKGQLLREVEEFTLRAVEGTRAVGDTVKNTVSVGKVVEVLRGLDGGMGNEMLYGYVAEATQRSLMEVATADAGAPATANLDTVLARFRSAVLLQRSTPDD